MHAWDMATAMHHSYLVVSSLPRQPSNRSMMHGRIWFGLFCIPAASFFFFFFFWVCLAYQSINQSMVMMLKATRLILDLILILDHGHYDGYG